MTELAGGRPFRCFAGTALLWHLAAAVAAPRAGLAEPTRGALPAGASGPGRSREPPNADSRRKPPTPLEEALAKETGLPIRRTQPPAAASVEELEQDEKAASAGYYDPKEWENADAAGPALPGGAARRPAVTFDHRYVLETGRLPYLSPEAEAVRLLIHGEYQVRAARLTDLPLARAREPGSGEQPFDSLGQTSRLYHWLRVRPRFDWFDRLSVIAEVDAPYGLFAGEKTRDVGAAREPLDDPQPVRADPRWLYAEWRHPYARIRVGQQPFHLGMGLIANDGDHPTLFGDYQHGDRVERVELGVRPLGAGSMPLVELALDLVFSDAEVDLREGDRAAQGVLRAILEGPTARADLTVVYREQKLDRSPEVSEARLVYDASGHLHAPLPDASGFVFGEYELVHRSGYARDPEGQRSETLRSYGGALRAGVVGTKSAHGTSYGRWLGLLEVGWASRDSVPGDRTDEGFAFHPNHNVGLILFDEVLAWKSARAATLARHENGASWESVSEPTNGAAVGAVYVNPGVIFRPLPELDLRAGVVLAQATGPFVDATTPELRNYDGGTPGAKDLGLEADLGFEYRFRLEHDVGLALGAQGGVFFPGRAFDDASRHGLGTQAMGVGRVGFQF